MSRILLISSLLLNLCAFGQDPELWTDHLPYNTIKDLAADDQYYYCATEFGIFTFDYHNNEVKTISKLNGLSDIGVNAIAYNEQNKTLIIGYDNANIDLLSGSSVVNMGDIKRASSYIGKKRINHILTRGDKAFLATGFGIVEIDIKEEIVTSTFIIGPNASELEVFQIAINEPENKIYAATPDGLYSASLTDPLLYYQSWQKDTVLPEGEINKVACLGNKTFANKITQGNVEDSVFYKGNNDWQYMPDQGQNKKYDLRVVNDMLCITNPFTANFYTPDLTTKYIIGPAYYAPGTFAPSCGYIMPDQQTMLIGNDKHGLIMSKDVTTNSRVTPNGPWGSEAVGLAAENKKMYVATGAISETWINTFSLYGVYALDDFEWEFIEPDAVDNVGDIVDVAIDPKDVNHVFLAAWGTGIVELKNNELVQVWNYQNTGGALQGRPGELESPRTGGVAFDEEGNLWVTSSQSERPIAVYKNDGTWENFSAGAFGGSTTNFWHIITNELGQKWLQTRTKGIVVMRENGNQTEVKQITEGEGRGNLPNNTVLSFAEDVDGEMWIGTSEGLVVLYSPQNIFENGKNFDAQPVLFEEDDVVQRLLGTEAISAIAIDGANKKWFGTRNSGVFYTSEDGTETIHHFTEDNSPLFSNTILDIAIDNTTGEVYFATARGIISFRGSATRGFDEYTDVFAYPNPVRANYDGPIYIKGLVTNARVKITDAAGNLVFETIAEGGQARWDGYTLDGDKVTSGVYLAYITDDLAERTTVTKIVVIR